MNRIRILTLWGLLAICSAFAAGTESILGEWKTEGDESKVEIFRCEQALCGRIVWLKNPYYTDSSDGPIGKPILDHNNPDPGLRGRQIIGIRIMQGFSRQEDRTWGSGTIYDPKSGRTYRGTIHLADDERLELRGYVGIPLFGRTSVWTR